MLLDIVKINFLLKCSILFLLLVVVSACNHEQVINKERVKAHQLLFDAQKLGADTLAAAEYQAAQEKLQQAEALVSDFRYKQAREALGEFYELVDLATETARGHQGDVKSELKGVAQSAAQSVQTSVTGTSKTYTVKKGDVLWKIGRTVSVNFKDIFKANTQIIKDPDLIYPGQELQIPQ